MTRLDTIHTRQEAIRSRLSDLQALPGPEDEGEATETTEEARSASTAALAEVDQLLAEWDTLEVERAPLAARQEKVDAALSRAIPTQGGSQTRTLRTEDGDGNRSAGPQVVIRKDPFAVLEDRSAHGRELTRALVDSNLRANEGSIEGAENQAHFERLVKRHGADHKWAANILARSKPGYSEAWSKMITGQAELLDPEERALVAIGTTTQGGLLLPTHLDPTLILTNSGSTNALRSADTRKVTLTEGNVWHGVTTAGVTASFDAELTAVSDDSPTIASASITCFAARGFVGASIEAFQDIAGLQQDVVMLFADAKDRLEGGSFMTGGGTTDPLGLFTAINASSTLKTTSTTAATIGEVDIHALYRALPIRWRGNGTFVANPLYTLAVKRLGTAISSAYSGDLTMPVTDRILGRPVLESDDCPTTQTTTALDQEIVFASLSNFIIVDKPGGTSLEFIPMLFDQATALPNGSRGWFLHWRVGSGMPALGSGRILCDKTSA